MFRGRLLTCDIDRSSLACSATPGLSRVDCRGRVHGPLDPFADQVRCAEQRVGVQMGVAGCRLRLRMTEELADDREAKTRSRPN